RLQSLSTLVPAGSAPSAGSAHEGSDSGSSDVYGTATASTTRASAEPPSTGHLSRRLSPAPTGGRRPRIARSRPAARGGHLAAPTGTVRTEYAANTPASAISSVSVQVLSRRRQSPTRVAASSTANAADSHEIQSGGIHSAKKAVRSPTATTPPY